MKKLITIGALIASSAAFAGGSGVVMEYDYDRGEGKDSGKNSNSVSIAPYFKFGEGWTADVKLDTSRDVGQTNGKNKEIKDSMMGRIRKDYKLTNDLKVGLRLGVGERFTQSSDYSFYTIEPMVQYNITNDWNVNALYRYRNSFDQTKNYQTDTYKIGTSYKVTPNDELGFKYSMKYGDSRANGVEFTYARGF
jgi:hypothetical protein